MVGGALLLHRARRVRDRSTSRAEAGRHRQRRRQAVELGLQLRRRQTSTRPGVQAELDGEPRRKRAQMPVLYLPVNKRVEFVLNSRDVIHSFWVPAFLHEDGHDPGQDQPVPARRRPRSARSRASAPSCAASTTRRCSSTSRSSRRPSTTQHIADLKASGQDGLSSVDAAASTSAPATARTSPASAAQGATDGSRHDVDRETHAHGMTAARRDCAKGQTVVKWITTTDHKMIGNLYLITSFVFFLLGGVHGAAHPRRAGRARACRS